MLTVTLMRGGQRIAVGGAVVRRGEALLVLRLRHRLTPGAYRIVVAGAGARAVQVLRLGRLRG
jgi:hypothetical protein